MSPMVGEITYASVYVRVSLKTHFTTPPTYVILINKKYKIMRLSKQLRSIIEAHIDAYVTASPFDSNEKFRGADEIVNFLKEGKTSKVLMDIVLERYVSISSQLIASTFRHASINFKKDVRTGFIQIFKELNLLP